MELRYFAPSPSLRPLISSYYYAGFSDARTDHQRAEAANLRVFLRGSATAPMRAGVTHAAAPSAMLCGVTTRSDPVTYAEGTEVFGIAFTPAGWRQFFGIPVDQMLDRVEDFFAVDPGTSDALVDRIGHAAGHGERVEAADQTFLSLASRSRRLDADHIAIVSNWLAEPELASVDVLIERLGVSSRQTERICRAHFGTTPKPLFRKFRVLHASNRMAWDGMRDWRAFAHPSFYDQSHFIREFRAFVGITPKRFSDGPGLLIRQNLMARLAVRYETRIGLIG